MPESPEIASRAREMNDVLPGKVIKSIDILQPKCLNLPAQDFCAALSLARIEEVSHHGKWIKVRTSRGWLLINLGMGGEILLTSKGTLPAKYRAVFYFLDDTCLSINFWWFGYLHYAGLKELSDHKMTARLGPDVLSLTSTQFEEVLSSQPKRARIKAVLLDQSRMAGIGNAYIHDILFTAGLHPNRIVQSISAVEVEKLYHSIQDSLRSSLDKGGAFYEVNLFGAKGHFEMEDILVGYREGQACPQCGSIIHKIKTGSTSSFICPNCQPFLIE